jgi:ABC-type multidrug transport system ATPase subunit
LTSATGGTLACPAGAHGRERIRSFHRSPWPDPHFKGWIEAVRGVDLDVTEGEIFGFLGPNGAGKSTTGRMLCTLLPPTSGGAKVAGHDVVGDGDEVRRNIGVALQEIGLDPVQTGRELLELQCGLYGITGSAGCWTRSSSASR